MKKYESIYDNVVREITTVINIKPIIVLVSQESDVMEEIFSRASCFDFRRFDQDKKQAVSVEYDRETFRNHPFNSRRNATVNVYTQYVKNGDTLALTATGTGDAAKALLAGPEYFIIHFLELLSEESQKTFLMQYISDIEMNDQLRRDKHMFVVSPITPKVPDGFQKYVHVIDVPHFGEREIAEMIVEWQKHRIKKVAQQMTVEEYLRAPDPYLGNFKGLNRDQIRSVLQRTSTRFGCVSTYRLPEQSHVDKQALFRCIDGLINEEKAQIAAQSGMITFVNVENAIEPGGMEGMFEWIGRNKVVLDHPESAAYYDERIPKGVLISGLPGSGKSAMAKYSAKLMGLKLVQFRFSIVLGGIVGQSEAQMEEALKIIDAISPVVVWIDEIEKEFAGLKGGDGDNGVTKRLFARILNWMQENNKCFIFATANDISTLPSELLRRGRFDRSYYTFLPMHEQCVEIFEKIMQGNIKHTPELFDKEIQDNLQRLGMELFNYIAQIPGKFYTGADIGGLIEEAKSKLFQKRNVQEEDGTKRKYGYEEFKEALMDVARIIKPYGESNRQKVLDYWMMMRENAFISAALPESVYIEDADALKQTKKKNEKKYQYLMFDFEDLQKNGKDWKWREGMRSVSQHLYDQRMFECLRKEILEYAPVWEDEQRANRNR